MKKLMRKVSRVCRTISAIVLLGRRNRHQNSSNGNNSTTMCRKNVWKHPSIKELKRHCWDEVGVVRNLITQSKISLHRKMSKSIIFFETAAVFKDLGQIWNQRISIISILEVVRHQICQRSRAIILMGRQNHAIEVKAAWWNYKGKNRKKTLSK